VSALTQARTKHQGLPQSTAEAAQRAYMLENLRKIRNKQHMGEVLDAVTASKYFDGGELADSSSHSPIIKRGSGNKSLPAAPHGAIPVNTTARWDPLTGHSFVTLLEGPATLTKPLVLSEQDTRNGPRAFENAPSFAGMGVSFAWWHRHSTPQVKPQAYTLHPHRSTLYPQL